MHINVVEIPACGDSLRCRWEAFLSRHRVKGWGVYKIKNNHIVYCRDYDVASFIATRGPE